MQCPQKRMDPPRTLEPGQHHLYHSLSDSVLSGAALSVARPGRCKFRSTSVREHLCCAPPTNS